MMKVSSWDHPFKSFFFERTLLGVMLSILNKGERMKKTSIIKREYFGTVTLGVCTVKLTKVGDQYEVRKSQGTSSVWQETFDASYAEELFKQYCEEALKENGPFQA